MLQTHALQTLSASQHTSCCRTTSVTSYNTHTTLSLSHTHTHTTLSLSLSHTHTHTSLSLSLTHTKHFFYRPTQNLHLNPALTGNFLHFYFLKKTHSVRFKLLYPWGSQFRSDLNFQILVYHTAAVTLIFCVCVSVSVCVFSGGADSTFIRTLGKSSINMDVLTFMSLKQSVINVSLLSIIRVWWWK